MVYDFTVISRSVACRQIWLKGACKELELPPPPRPPEVAKGGGVKISLGELFNLQSEITIPI